MPITITKAKEKAIVAPVVALDDPSEMTDSQLADLYGSLQDQITALGSNPIFARFEEAKEAVKNRLNDMAPTDSAVIKGEHWKLEIGGCNKAPRKILDMEACMTYIPKAQFAKIAKIGVTDAEKYLTPEQFESVVSEDAYTLNRKITPVFMG